MLEEIWEGAGGNDKARALALFHPSSAPFRKKWLAKAHRGRGIPSRELLAHTGLTCEVADFIAHTAIAGELVGMEPEIISCPLVSEKDAIELALKDSANTRVRIAIVGREKARQDPRIRSFLIKTSSTEILKKWAEVAETQEDFEFATVRLFSKDPLAALRLLQSMPVRAHLTLPRNPIIRALGDASAEVRAEALAVIGRWRQGGAKIGPETPKRQRKIKI